MKHWLYTYWMSWGPIEVIHGKHQPLISKAWMRSVDRPYLDGVGIAIRIGRNVIRFGVCRPTDRIFGPESEGALMRAVFAHEADDEWLWDSVAESA